jgi:hypothetical protein
MNPLYPPVATRAGHRCEYCHAPEAIFNVPFEVEHIRPVSLGGDNSLENLSLACRMCNLAKSNHLTAVDPEESGVHELFHPRRDRWEDHFEVQLPAMTVAGLTPSGRATIACLGINRPRAVVARQHWSRIGLYP